MLEEDWWPFCFLAQNDYDVDITYPIVIQCLKWRKSFCVQRIRILELKPLLEKSAIYMYGRDLNSFPILWFKMNRIKVDEANAEELFIYWLERYRTSAKREYPVTLLFDMSGTGLQNLSLEFVRFILHAFKYYYPCCLGLLLVYENPTILSASWRLVKSWMDTMMQPPLKHVTRESIGNYISSYYVPIEMGGKVSRFIYQASFDVYSESW
uniref:CRAL-TRIO domain-containing protein n=1 Tax=Syphacia muris TaxID=451379 RepID=A0A0N5AB12_9BILA